VWIIARLKWTSELRLNIIFDLDFKAVVDLLNKPYIEIYQNLSTLNLNHDHFKSLPMLKGEPERCF